MKPSSVFVQRKVRLLVSYPDEGLNVGDIVTCYLVPNGYTYLKTSNGIFETDAVVSVHFEETP